MEIAKKKWKNLCDNYRRLSISAGTKNKKIVWKYYEQMSFIKHLAYNESNEDKRNNQRFQNHTKTNEIQKNDTASCESSTNDDSSSCSASNNQSLKTIKTEPIILLTTPTPSVKLDSIKAFSAVVEQKLRKLGGAKANIAMMKFHEVVSYLEKDIKGSINVP